jgi:hypothetical protein
MKKDFLWLRAVINHPDNTGKHTEAIYTLIQLFKKKWSHIESHPTMGGQYALYLSYFRITMKSLNN